MKANDKPEYTEAILMAVAKGNPPFTAQGVTAEVKKRFPKTNHLEVTTRLFQLVDAGQVIEHRQPRLPARFSLKE